MKYEHFLKHKGDNCDEDYDACATEPCRPGECIDASPEQEQQNTAQYTCVGCPDGYELDEIGECAG